MKEKWLKIGKISLGVVAGLSLLATLIAAIGKDMTSQCKEVQIKVNYENGVNFIDEEELHKIITDSFSNNLIGQELQSIDFGKIERTLKHNPYVRNAEVYGNMHGALMVQVEQKKPILRIINKSGVSYYLSDYGDSIPLSSKFTPRVLVAYGNIDAADNASLKKLSDFIDADNFWNAAVEQVFVDDKKNFELYTKLGNQNVILGKVDDELAEKFNKLKILYTEGLPNVGWNKYKTIDLKFKKQVVCTKI
jgi:cell division protein FtsQ